MSRQIKFRAWIKRRNKMFKWEDLEGVANGMGWLNTTKCKVMQFIGLFDKDGKEIYEGDIVKYIFFKGRSWYLSMRVVEWCDIRTKFDFKIIQEIRINREIVKQSDLGEGKVIGNIYENPELMEAKK